MCQRAAEAAIAAGYRHIDTAYSYRVEVEVGKAIQSMIQQGIIRRQDMFIVSKVSSSYVGALKIKSMCAHFKGAKHHAIMMLLFSSCGVPIMLLKIFLFA